MTILSSSRARECHALLMLSCRIRQTCLAASLPPLPFNHAHLLAKNEWKIASFVRDAR